MPNLENSIQNQILNNSIEVELPEFAFEQKRWATFRSLNVNLVSNMWRTNPDRVIIFTDPRLESGPLALIKKEKLEKLIKLLKDIDTGQASIEHNVEILIETISLAEDLAQSAVKDPKGIPVLRKAITILGSLKSSLTSRIRVTKSSKKVKPSPPTEMEQLETLTN